MTKFRASISSFLCTFVLTGCATTGGNAIYTPAVGSQVKVIEQLNAAGGKRLIIQNGRVLERQDVHVISPYCQFSLNRSWEEMSEPIAIRPGMFTISKSYRQQDWSWAEGTQFAGDTDRSMSTVMELSSDQQPEVSSLVCTRWGSVYVGGWVTIKEMRATLNGLVQLDDPTE